MKAIKSVRNQGRSCFLYDDMNDAISNENIYQGSIAWIIDFTCKNIEKMADPYGSLEYDLFPERFDL